MAAGQENRLPDASCTGTWSHRSLGRGSALTRIGRASTPSLFDGAVDVQKVETADPTDSLRVITGGV